MIKNKIKKIFYHSLMLENNYFEALITKNKKHQE